MTERNKRQSFSVLFEVWSLEIWRFLVSFYMELRCPTHYSLYQTVYNTHIFRNPQMVHTVRYALNVQVGCFLYYIYILFISIINSTTLRSMDITENVMEELFATVVPLSEVVIVYSLPIFAEWKTMKIDTWHKKYAAKKIW